MDKGLAHTLRCGCQSQTSPPLGLSHAVPFTWHRAYRSAVRKKKLSTFDFQMFQVPYIFTLKLMNAIRYLDSLGCPTERFISHFI